MHKKAINHPKTYRKTTKQVSIRGDFVHITSKKLIYILTIVLSIMVYLSSQRLSFV